MRAALDGPVATITFEHPHTLGEFTVAALHGAMDSAESDRGVRVLVLRATDGAFCTGMDFDELGQKGSASSRADCFFDLLDRCGTSRLLIVSIVDGQATGGGVGLAAASDHVIAGPRARFALPEARWGLLPCTVLPFLVRRTGFQHARRMTLGLQPVDARRAADIGLADEAVEHPEAALRRVVARVSTLDPDTIWQAKRYLAALAPLPREARAAALAQFHDLATGPAFGAALDRYLREGRHPWDAQD
jgi:polyketide biosynthesis enoyl-CoA hydratase PksH